MPVTSLHRIDRQLTREAVRFLVVGASSYAVDVVVFNLLAHGPGTAPMTERPVTAKVISTILSALVSFFGNKFWTFGDRSHEQPWQESFSFLAVNFVAWAITLAPLAFSRYALGLDGVVADNISGSLIGLGLALAFRFWAYRRWVFPLQSIRLSTTTEIADR